MLLWLVIAVAIVLAAVVLVQRTRRA